MNFVAIDFETANFKRQSVCAIGLVIVKNFKIVKTYSRLIKPTPNYYEHINMSIHGINQEMTENESVFSDLWEEIRPLIDNQQLIAHNASFDFSALRYVLDSYQIEYPTLEYYCTMLLSKKVFPGLINYQLPTVCNHLEIKDLSHHDALSDAKACANIMIHIGKHYKVNSLKGLGEKVEFTEGRIFSNSYRPFSSRIRKKLKTQLFEVVPEDTNFDEEHPFYQKRVVFTGTLSKLSRVDAKQIVANIGGIIKPNTLSNKTNYLVVGIYDFNKYGDGFKSIKLKKAEEMIKQGRDLEIISEVDFFKMVHSEESSFEISLDQINSDSKELIRRNKYNDFSNKKIFFSSNLSIERTTAFQLVGNCSGYGHDYDEVEIANSDYFVIADELINNLENGIKNKSIIDFEQKRNNTQNRRKSIKLISEATFFDYMERRRMFQKGEIKMNIYEWEIDK